MRVQDLDHDELKDYWLSVQQRIQRLQAHSDEIQALIKERSAGGAVQSAQVLKPGGVDTTARFGAV